MSSHYKCLPKGFIAVMRFHVKGNSFEGKHLIGASTQFRDLVHYCIGREHGSPQADIILEST